MTPARRSLVSKARPATAGSWSLPWKRQGTRCSTCRRGAPIASAVATDRARPTPAMRLQSPKSCCTNETSSGPALEPELVRALALLELQRRRLVRDRTQAIQRLRADWNQVDPVGEARVVNLTRQRELRRLKRISFGDGLVEQVAARCIRDLAREIEDLNQRIAVLDTEIGQLLAEHGNPVGDLHGAGPQIA